MADNKTQKRASQDTGVLSKPPSGRPTIQIKYAAGQNYAKELSTTSSKHLLFQPSETDIHHVKYPLHTRPLSAKASLSTTPNIQTLQLEDNEYIRHQRHHGLPKRESPVAPNPDLDRGSTSRTVKIECDSGIRPGTSKHLLFEPDLLRNQSPSPWGRASGSTERFRRRPQSAKARLESNEHMPSSSTQERRAAKFSNDKYNSHSSAEYVPKKPAVRQRPQSAKFAKERDVAASGTRRRPVSAKPRLDWDSHREAVKCRTLQIDVKTSESAKHKLRDSASCISPGTIDVNFPYKLSDTVEEKMTIKEEKEREKHSVIPKGIAALAPFLTQDIPSEWCGIDPKTCLVFLPSLLYQDEDLPVVPLPQQPNDVIPHTVVPPSPKAFDPKKLFHYTGDKDRTETMMCDHTIFSSDGKILHDASKYAIRTRDVIQREIEDLENLLQGIGRAESDNIVVQYQHDINILQREVRRTLRKTRHIRSSSPEEDPPDLFGLRQFYREHDETIRRIRTKREACLQELSELEANLGMQLQREVMKEYS